MPNLGISERSTSLLIQQKETMPGGPIPVPTPFLFRCDNDDQREVILKSSVAEADHFLRNCGEHVRGYPTQVNEGMSGRNRVSFVAHLHWWYYSWAKGF